MKSTKRLKRIEKLFASLFLCAAVAVSGAIQASASDKTSDVKIDCKKAKETYSWGQSLSIPKEDFDIGRITEKTQFIVTFEYKDSKDAENVTKSPVGLALQSYSNPDNALADDKGGVWAEVTPTSYDQNSAIFYYQDIVKAYTSKDFSKVDYLHVIAPSEITIKCTGLTITDCNDKAPETTTTTAAAEVSQAEEETTTEAVTTTTQAAAPAESAASATTSASSSPIALIVGIIAGIAIAVIIIVVIMNKKSSKAFDVSTGTFVDKKNVKDAKK